MINIRLFKEKDYKDILMWWIKSGELPPSLNMLPLDSTFILEYEGTPILSMCVYFTNTKEIAYSENLIGNPNFKGPKRRELVPVLFKYVENFAKDKGYKRFICFSYKDKLKKRYKNLGYKPTVNNLTSFVKEL